ncbi:MAG: nitrous oxide reductase family maturation protein NosD [Candidatus Hodarchaeota archaeon]
MDKKCKLTLAITIFFSIFSSCFLKPDHATIKNEIIQLDGLKSSSPHPIIALTNNTALEAFPNKTGNGTVGNPYIIEDIEITINSSNTCLNLENIDKHLTIQNCTLTNTVTRQGTGLSVLNCTNLKVINCTISNCNTGIYLDECSNNSFDNNSVVNNTNNMRIYFSHFNNITRCNITGGYFYGMYIYYSDEIIIKESTISQIENGPGIHIYFSGHIHIISNTVANNDVGGINIQILYNSTVIGNNISNNSGYGLYTDTTNNITYENNFVSNNTPYNFHLGNPSDITMRNNSFYGTGLSLNPIYIDEDVDIGTTNSVDNRTIYYYFNETGLRAANFSDPGQVILVKCKDSEISGLNSTVGFAGINVYYSNGTFIGNNSFTSTGEHGILVSGSNTTQIENNTIQGASRNGIYLHNSTNASLYRNNASYNGYRGIDLYTVMNATVNENEISNNNASGLEVALSTNITINDNNATCNGGHGIYCSQTQFIAISENNINDNDGAGLSSWYLVNGSIIENDIRNNLFDGIFIVYFDEGEISDNTVTGNGYFGLNIRRTDDSEFSRNNVSSNGYSGILVVLSQNNIISDNSVFSNNDNGIYMRLSDLNLITRNHVSHNLNSGIYLVSSNENEICHNTVHYNEHGCIEEDDWSSNYVHDNDCKYSQAWINEHVITPMLKIMVVIAIIAIVITLYAKNSTRIKQFITKPARDVPLQLELKRVKPLIKTKAFTVPRMVEMTCISGFGTTFSLLYWKYADLFPEELVDMPTFFSYLFIAFIGIGLLASVAFQKRNANLLATLRWVNGTLAVWCFIYFMSYTFWQLYILRYGYNVMGAGLLAIAFPGSTPYVEFPRHGVIFPDGEQLFYNFTVTCAHPVGWGIPIGVILFYPGLSWKSKVRKNIAFFLVDHLVYLLAIVIQSIIHYHTGLSWKTIHEGETTAAIMALINIAWRVVLAWYLFPDVRLYSKKGYNYLKKRMKKGGKG